MSIKELRQICQKSENAPSWRTQSLEGRFNRIFSIYLTWIFSKLNIQPTPINILGALAYLGGASLFVFNRFDFQVIGLFLMFLSFILDACDGELARFYKLSPAKLAVGGAYIEPVSHDIMYAFFFFPIGIGVTLATSSLLPTVLAFILTVSKLLFRLAELRYDFLQRILAENKGEVLKCVQGASTPKTISYAIFRNFFTGTGTFTLLIVAVFIRHIDWFLYFYAISFFLLWAYKMSRQWKRIKKQTQPLV